MSFANVQHNVLYSVFSLSSYIISYARTVIRSRDHRLDLAVFDFALSTRIFCGRIPQVQANTVPSKVYSRIDLKINVVPALISSAYSSLYCMVEEDLGDADA